MPSLPRNKPRLAAFVTFLGLLAVGSFFLLRSQKQCKAESLPSSPQNKAQAVPVRVLSVEAREFALPVPATGTLMARETVTLVSELSRRLVRVQAVEGQLVKKGQLLFQLDASDLTAEKQRVDVQLEFARRDAKRQQELLSAQVATAAELDHAESVVKELEASRRILDVTLAKTTIAAPFDGWLGLRQVSAGAWVTPTTPLITIADTSELKIDFRIPERHASSIQVGGGFSIRVEGQPAAVDGKITATEPSIDESSRTLLVRGVIQGESGLKPGSFARVELPLVMHEAIIIPNLAILPSVSGRSVLVAKEGKAKLVAVELGSRTADSVQVLSGLQVGDQLIVSNLLRVQDGTPIQLGKAQP